MTIQNYTFFSPNGTEFPVSANADGKLYQILTGMELDGFRRRDWEQPIDTALNRQYVNTSLVVGGRYFELRDETVELSPSIVNYIHANIDLTNVNAPVSISVEASDNSNGLDVNNKSGILKKCFDKITTDTSIVTSASAPEQIFKFDFVEGNQIREKGDKGLIIGAASSGWTLSKTPTARLANNQLLISIPSIVNSTAKNHTWYDVADFSATLGNVTAYGDTYVAAFDGNNSNGQLWRARFMDGKFRVLPEILSGSAKRYAFCNTTFLIE
jgi:hypothetical protein